jgi:TPR repeat protein
MRVRMAFACALFCALLSPSALAHDPNAPSSDTFTAILKSLKKLTRADLAVIMQRVDANDPRAQMLLAIIYRDGLLVQGDSDAYLKFLKASAEQGYAAAQTELGSYYAVNGKVDDATGWFEKAALQGNMDAEYDLAMVYSKAEAVTENSAGMVKALPFFRRAAMQGHPIAQFIMALAYHEGRLVERDEQQCKKWMLASAEQGYSKAQFSVAARHYLVSEFDNAFTWFKRAAEQKHPRAELNLASMYYVGQGTTKDLQQAMYWYQRAAEHGESSALRMIGSMYRSGVGVEKDPVASYTYLQAAAAAGDQQASLEAAKAAGLLSEDQRLEASRRVSSLVSSKEKLEGTGTLAISKP